MRISLYPIRSAALLVVIELLTPNFAHSFEFSADRAAYLGGEVPVYTIQGAPPNAPIYWSSSRDSQSTGEVSSFYGQITDAFGNWSSKGGSWDSSTLSGSWTKTAKIGQEASSPQATARFQITSSMTTGHHKSNVASMLSISHWGGVENSPNGDTLLEGAQLVQKIGANNIHLDMSPNYANKSYVGTDFGTSIHSLSDLASSPPFKNIFSRPFANFMLDTFSFSNWSWVDAMGNGQTPPFTAEMAARETAEVADLALSLMRSNKNTNKIFHLKNWEGDYMYHGGYDLSAPVSAAHTRSMIDWLNARQAGIVKAREEAQNEGLTGVQALGAVEFVDLYGAQNGRPSLLTDVIPYVQSDEISFSSYQSINRKVPVSALKDSILRDLAFVRGLPGMNERPLIIGEYGFSQDQFPNDAAARIDAATQAFMQAGIPLASYWQIEDMEKPHFGLYESDNTTLTATGEKIETLLNASPPQAANASPSLPSTRRSLHVAQNHDTPRLAVSAAAPDNYRFLWAPQRVQNLNGAGLPVSEASSELTAATLAIKAARTRLIAR